jgi:asparagine synthase (glutamine-hydrolysing)
MKAILASRVVGFDINANALNRYLHFGWVPEPDTLINGVTKLLPGHILTIDLRTWNIEERQYWGFDRIPEFRGDPVEGVRAALEESVSLMVRADVPVGVALSGGLDSSAIAAIACKKYPGAMQAFSAGYRGIPRQDERHLAKALARRLGLPIREVEIDSSDVVESFPTLNGMRDDPIADIAGHAYYALSRAAREAGCPVLLQGQGGDEIFWGYSWTQRAVEFAMQQGPRGVAHALHAIRTIIPAGVSASSILQCATAMGGVAAGWKRLSPPPSLADGHVPLYEWTDTFQIASANTKSTLTREFAARIDESAVLPFLPSAGRKFGVDISVMRNLSLGYLLQNGLAQGDRLSMANSVEARMPFVDYKLVETVVGIQKADPRANPKGKALLKGAVQDLLPPEVLQRPKRGFNPPVRQWVQHLKAAYGQDLADGYLVSAGVLCGDAGNKLGKRNFYAGPWNDMFIKYIGLEFWCRAMREVRS